MVFWNLSQIKSWPKWPSRILIQIASRLKKLSRFFIQINLRLKRFSRILIHIHSRLPKLSGILIWNQLMIQLYHYDTAYVPLDMTWHDLFWACPIWFSFVWPFGGFRVSTQMYSREINSNQLMTQAVSRRVESLQLMTQVAFQRIDSESAQWLMQIPSCIDSDQLMTQMASQRINPRPCTPIFITRTCRGGGRCDPPPRVSKLTVVKLSGKTGGLCLTSTYDWWCVFWS